MVLRYLRMRRVLTKYLVVGAKEQETRTVNIRNRDDLATQKMGELIPLDVALKGLKALKEERRQENKIDVAA
jgi:threonyl-tRNA synthetase